MDVAQRMGERWTPKECDYSKERFFDDSPQFMMLPMNLYLRDGELMRNSLSIEDSEE